MPLKDVVAVAKAENSHKHKIISADAIQASSEIAKLMGLHTDTLVFQLTLLHLQDDQPLQWQKIWVNRAMAPALLKQKLEKIDPNDYLHWICRPQTTDYQLKAVKPSASQRLELMLPSDDSPVVCSYLEESGPNKRYLLFQLCYILQISIIWVII